MINIFNFIKSKHDDFESNKECMFEKYKSKKELPKFIRLEACSICQLNCKACYMHLEEERAKNGCKFGYLKFKDFKKLVDDNNFENIELSNNGEIFLNPDLVKIIKYAYKKNINLTACNGVNLNFLSDEQAEALVLYKFDRLCVSIDGTSQDTYSQYRVGGNYDKVMENIKKIIDYKKKYNSKFPHITWKFIIFGFNEHQITEAKEIAKNMGIDEIIFTLSWENSSPIKNPEFVKQETGLDVLKESESDIDLLKKFKDGTSGWFFCKYLWEPQINWDGQLLGCCINFWQNFGCDDRGVERNVFKDGLLKTLNSSKYIYAKNMVCGKVPRIDDIPCGKCHVYNSMEQEKYWMDSLK